MSSLLTLTLLNCLRPLSYFCMKVHIPLDLQIITVVFLLLTEESLN